MRGLQDVGAKVRKSESERAVLELVLEQNCTFGYLVESQVVVGLKILVIFGAL